MWFKHCPPVEMRRCLMERALLPTQTLDLPVTRNRYQARSLDGIQYLRFGGTSSYSFLLLTAPFCSAALSPATLPLTDRSPFYFRIWPLPGRHLRALGESPSGISAAFWYASISSVVCKSEHQRKGEVRIRGSTSKAPMSLNEADSRAGSTSCTMGSRGSSTVVAGSEGSG